MFDNINDKKAKGKPRPSKKTSPPSKQKIVPAKGSHPSLPTLEDTVELQSETRRKRRRLSHEEATNLGAQVDEDAAPESWPYPAGSEDVLVPASSPPSLIASQPDNQLPLSIPNPSNQALNSAVHRPDTHQSNELATDHTKTPPKKMLKLNPRGRLVSPITKSGAVKEDLPDKKPARRGRPKKEKHLLVVGRYARDGPTGPMIDRILSAQERHVLPQPGPPPAKLKSKPAEPDVSKATHPFFLGKPKDGPYPKGHMNMKPVAASIVHLTESPRKTSAVTPGKLRAERQSARATEIDDSSVFVPFGAARDRMIAKVPGMTEAPWPSKDSAHVRGIPTSFKSSSDCTPVNPTNPRTIAGLSRKMKYRIAALDQSEDLLSEYQKKLNFDQDDTVRPDGFRDPPQSLRLPSRLLIPGSEIQNLVTKQLHTVPTDVQDATRPGVTQAIKISSICHPACQLIFDGIAATLTPYDQGKSEAMAWAQKYSPKSASQVLQPGKEAIILRDWMKALTIMTVEVSASQTSKPDKANPERKHKKKRRKKAEDLEGFIVDGDGDGNDLDELTDLDEDPWIAGARTGKRSLVQTADTVQRDRTKLANVILISGPSGSGKTAMAHAVAKELGFEIFEINSGARRSGKDVLDKVGDMVENHLVQRQAVESGSTSADEDGGRLAEAFKKDLASGRQGTMGSFFKPKMGSLQEPRKVAKPKVINQIRSMQPKSQSSRNQKQSLILLEEVDILFEEDKNFWPTMFTLIENSKRPVIMTCNDEDLVPIQALKMHAILRLSAPPANLAIDYLLLLAAKEGHVLSREAVSMLFESRGQDLRQSIADLQLWCQMGVGDPRGGLGWIFQRWPPGRGIDKQGQALRVVSKDTYQLGMGCFTHDPDTWHGNTSEEMLLESWEDWEIDPRDELFDGLESQQKHIPAFLSPKDRFAALRNYEALASSMSAIDIFSANLPGSIQPDPTQPELPDKSRTNYISGLALLQTPPQTSFSNLSTQIALTTTSLLAHTHLIPLPTTSAHLLSNLTSPLPHEPLTRAAFSSALDPLASAPQTSLHAPTGLSYSALDGAFAPIATDIAPYVRSIVAFDAALAAQRMQMQGEGKKARTTRAARSALEGGLRRLTRRERWFEGDVDFEAVLATGPRFAVVGAVAGREIEGGCADAHYDVEEVEE